MRQQWIVSILGGLIVCGMLVCGPVGALQAAETTRAQCVKMALEKVKLEKRGVRKILAMRPVDVRLKHGKPGIERVRSYIAIREKVLFHCPPDVLNMTAASLKRQQKFIPPLPQKRPKQLGGALPRDGRPKFPSQPG